MAQALCRNREKWAGKGLRGAVKWTVEKTGTFKWPDERAEKIKKYPDGKYQDKYGWGRKLEEDKRLIEEINEKIESFQEELLELPREIDTVNRELMYESVQSCYDILQNNTEVIEEISHWIKQVRIDLKKNIIRKQNCEINSK